MLVAPKGLITLLTSHATIKVRHGHTNKTLSHTVNNVQQRVRLCMSIAHCCRQAYINQQLAEPHLSAALLPRLLMVAISVSKYQYTKFAPAVMTDWFAAKCRLSLAIDNIAEYRGRNGGRDRDWTCDPYDVNVVPYSCNNNLYDCFYFIILKLCILKKSRVCTMSATTRDWLPSKAKEQLPDHALLSGFGYLKATFRQLSIPTHNFLHALFLFNLQAWHCQTDSQRA